jgi:hypothetical protein
MSNLRLSSPISHSTSSTAFAAEFLQQLLDAEVTASNLRSEYQSYFLQSCSREFSADADVYLHKALTLLSDNVVDENGRSVAQVVENSTAKIHVVVIEGNTAPAPLSLDQKSVASWIDQHIAEPAVMDIAKAAVQPDKADVLFAIGAGAECSPTKPWLNAGGTVAAVMRPNEARWKQLIAHTRASAGTLIVPVTTADIDLTSATDGELARVAGVDLTQDLEAVASFLRQVIKLSSRKLIVAGLVYVGGAQHVVAQAAQDALMKFAENNHPDTVLAWLGTPTDQTPVPLEVLEDSLDRYAHRTLMTRMRDSVLQLFKQAQRPLVELIDASHHTLAIRDCSSQMQGPNYILAKRAQRWRAYASARKGNSVAYIVTPPARTHSVLDYKILHATYRGAPRFGLQPFDAELTRQLSAASLAFQVEHPVQYSELDPTAVYFKYAVHAGLWRLRYNPQSIWVAATIRGALALALPKKI